MRASDYFLIEKTGWQFETVMDLPLPVYYDMLQFYGDPEEYLGIKKGKKGLPSPTERKKKIEAFRKAQSEKLKKESEKNG